MHVNTHQDSPQYKTNYNQEVQLQHSYPISALNNIFKGTIKQEHRDEPHQTHKHLPLFSIPTRPSAHGSTAASSAFQTENKNLLNNQPKRRKDHLKMRELCRQVAAIQRKQNHTANNIHVEHTINNRTELQKHHLFMMCLDQMTSHLHLKLYPPTCESKKIIIMMH